MASNKELSIGDKLKDLQQQFVSRLAVEIDMVQTQWKSVNLNSQTSDLADLIKILHRLAGSGATFGYPGVSDNARKAERLLKSCDNTNTEIVDVFKQVEKTLFDLSSAASLGSSKPFFKSRYLPELRCKTNDIYMLEDDEVLSSTLSSQIKSYGYNLHTFSSVAAFKEAISESMPDSLIVDISLDEGPDAGLAAIEELRSEIYLNIPIAVFTVQTDFSAKLRAKKAGVDAYLVKPVDVSILVNQLDRLIRESFHSEALRILIVDDDKTLSEHYSLVLSHAGMMTKTITNPKECIEAVASFNPDIVILDIYMPQCSGIDVAGVIRFHPQYLHIPIVFLSTEAHIDQQLAALRTGGDDFLQKPIDDKHLVESIRIRALRARRVNELIMYDSLTGLLKHSALKERISNEFFRKERAGPEFCYAMIDLDNFKQINDTFGHPVGDRVINSLARMLKSRIRIGDLVGRYGGEEFGLILLDCELDCARRILDDIRHDFSKLKFYYGNETFHATFSAGIAYSKEFTSSDEIINAADTVLYAAKDAGRNNVMTTL